MQTRNESRRNGLSGSTAGPKTAQAKPASRRRWLMLALVGILAFVGAWAFCELVLWARVPPELVGKWVVTEGPDEGGTIDFYRGGTMVAKVNLGGREGIIEARIRVEDRTIHITTRNRETGEEGVRVQTIKALDATHLILEDERGISVKLERAK